MALPKAKPLPPAPTRPETNNWRTRLYAGTKKQQDRRKYARLRPCEKATAFRKRMQQEIAQGKHPSLDESKPKARKPNPTDGQGHGLPPSDDIPF